jgi:uncharacterized membrane protein
MSGTDAIAAAGLVVHTIAAVVWVGGMFFALLVLRPAAGPLDPALRLELWARTLGRFFLWVIAAIVLLLVSGYGMVLEVFGGFQRMSMHVQVMQGLGIIMMLAFFHLYFAPFRRMKRALARRDYPAAARQLAQIRLIVTFNLLLGLVTVAVGSGGRYWG